MPKWVDFSKIQQEKLLCFFFLAPEKNNQLEMKIAAQLVAILVLDYQRSNTHKHLFSLILVQLEIGEEFLFFQLDARATVMQTLQVNPMCACWELFSSHYASQEQSPIKEANQTTVGGRWDWWSVGVKWKVELFLIFPSLKHNSHF